MKKSTEIKLKQLEKLSVNLIFYQPIENNKGVIDSIDIQYDHLALFEFFIKSFDFIRKNNEKDAIDDVKKRIVEVSNAYNYANPTLDNALSLYLQFYLSETNIELLKKDIVPIEKQSIIIQDFDINEIGLRIEINRLIGKVLLYSTFYSTDPEYKKRYFETLSIAYIDIKHLLDKRRSKNLNEEARLGLMCLYYLIIKVLRISNKEDNKVINKFILLIEKHNIDNDAEVVTDEIKNDGGTMDLFKKALEKHKLYARIINNEQIEKLEAGNIFETACLKLYGLIPKS